VRERWASATLDGDVYAQPLVVGERVVVATTNDTIYSLDVSDGTTVWKTHVGEPVSASALPCGNVDPVGITSTPVVDTAANRVFAVGMVQPGQHMLFELDLSTGDLVASARVDANGADPAVHNQRAALSLSAGVVFVPYGGRFGDCGDYRGRVVAASVSASGIGNIASYTLPTQGRAGFWAPPGATLGADGTLYLASGNSTSSDLYDYGNSVIRLDAGLKLIDSFAPRDWATLDVSDTDLGSTSPVLLPNNRVFQVGKSGTGYLLDAEHLGGIGGQLHAGTVCSAPAFGGVAHDGDRLFVPCSDGVAEVVVNANTFTVRWTTAVSRPGPTIVAGDAVWTVATASGDLLALDASTGKTLSTHHIGAVPSRFTSPAAGDGLVVVAAQRRLLAFGT
jgi:outer membrane protein assembly factor BamB